MTIQGAPDWTNAVYLVAVDEEGNQYPVKINAAGRLECVIVGAGETTLAALTVEDGRLICVIQDAVTGEPVAIDTGGRMQVRLVAMIDEDTPHDVTVNEEGHLIMVLRDSTNDRYLAIDEAGNIVAVMKGDYEGALKTVTLDEDGRMEAVVKGTKDVVRGLRLWYKFRSAEGSNIIDSSPWGNNGIAYHGAAEGATYDDGIVGQALKCDGDIDRLIVANDPSIRGWTELTVLTWIKITGFIGISRYLYDYGFDIAPNYGFLSYCHATNNTLYTHIKNTEGDSQFGYVAFTPDTWMLIGFRWDGERLCLVLNDTVPDVGAFTGTVDPATVFAIGSSTTGILHADVIVGEMRLYSVGLTDAEIGIYYNFTKPGGTGALQEIAVNTRGQIEIQAKDANALIRNLLVDTAGRLIIVPRGESGYYLDVDASGFLTALMKGQEIGAGYKTIATDEDGKMLAVVRNFPYEDTIVLKDTKAVALGATGFINLGGPPAGVIWVITNVAAVSDGQVGFLGIEVYINRGGDMYWIEGDGAADKSIYKVARQCELFLKNPDVLYATFTDASGAATIHFWANGYAVPVYS